MKEKNTRGNCWSEERGERVWPVGHKFVVFFFFLRTSIENGNVYFRWRWIYWMDAIMSREWPSIDSFSVSFCHHVYLQRRLHSLYYSRIFFSIKYRHTFIHRRFSFSPVLRSCALRTITVNVKADLLYKDLLFTGAQICTDGWMLDGTGQMFTVDGDGTPGLIHLAIYYCSAQKKLLP